MGNDIAGVPPDPLSLLVIGVIDMQFLQNSRGISINAFS